MTSSVALTAVYRIYDNYGHLRPDGHIIQEELKDHVKAFVDGDMRMDDFIIRAEALASKYRHNPNSKTTFYHRRANSLIELPQEETTVGD